MDLKNQLEAGWNKPEISLVIAVYNGSQTICGVVEEIRAAFHGWRFEIILVNDGSGDDSEKICGELAEQHPGEVSLLQLARNFGEHNAVLAGLKYACGEYVVVLDDDGQNSPSDAQRLLVHARDHDLDVVYARYPRREHPWLRILASRCNDAVATLLLGKPRNLYLSSFKVLSRFLVDELAKHSGPNVYLDGLILRITRRIGQIEVEHRPRRAGRSGYTLSKLLGLWLNMCVGTSLVPLRIATVVGIILTTVGLLMLSATGIFKVWLDPQYAAGIPSLIALAILAIGVELIAVGVLGEYVGRAFLHQSGAPPYVLRYVRGVEDGTAGHGGTRFSNQSMPARIG
jgi:undecaprenyl-phosphate 4-deoxy-4-formamido-L-arabinose transferase